MKACGASRLALAALWLALSGCTRPLPESALVITQIPANGRPAPIENLLDARYPPGTRVAIVAGTNQKIRVLSAGLIAAGDPVVSCDGHRIVFAGKKSPTASWQIYENSPEGGRPEALTAVPAGAMDPALLGDGTLLYVSPVPAGAGSPLPADRPALFAQGRREPPRRLTFGLAVSDPTVLGDGRILFVSTGPSQTPSGSALYTINNDGTELTAYAGQHDRPAWLRRPRELYDGRIAFLASHDERCSEADAEFVSSARPFASRAKLFPNSKARVHSIQPAFNGDWLICAPIESDTSDLRDAVFQVNAAVPVLERPRFDEPAWSSIEATPVGAGRRPMGRLSNVDATRDTGQILCLNANDTSLASPAGSRNPARRIRVFTNGSSGHERLLGEVEVQPDGSFMAEVPADLPLGFEAIDEHGTVLRREPPLVWVRPGENRACIGCHEQHNHSPRNLRPLAVRVVPPRLVLVADKLVQTSP